MAKHIFQPMEIVDLTKQRVKIDAPVFKEGVPVSEIASEQAVIEKLREETEALRKSWKAEKEQIIQQAQDEAKDIISNARESASELEISNTEETERIKKAAELEAAEIISQAKEETKRLLLDAEAERDKVYAEAREIAEKEGHETGWEGGKAEVERLIERLHGIINATIEKRRAIFVDVEAQIVDLVLLIARKVIKLISENQKNVVIHNIEQALNKLKSRADVTIRVNLADLEMATAHVKDFMNMIEDVKSINVLEDSSIEKGGAVIETDFGQIDARIHSQLREIEDKILEIVPIKSTEDG